MNMTRPYGGARPASTYFRRTHPARHVHRIPGMTDSTVYRSPTALAAIDEQRRRLDLHRTDPATGRCGACGRTGPCPDANDAAIFLAERGLLVPVQRWM